MKLKTTISLIVLLVFANNLNAQKKKEYHLKEIPPNCIKVADNFFCDQTEISNISWRAYQHWIRWVFGANSPEYEAASPDSLVWREILDYNYNSPYIQYYFSHVANHAYPVVGISQQQALEYSKWRSDRVFEMLLVKSKKMKWWETITKENYFTIEKYFNGEIDDRIIGEKVEYYPEYRLPTLEERQIILQYSDSIEKKYFQKQTSRRLKSINNDENSDFLLIHNRATVKESCPVPTINVYYWRKGKNQIYHLRGNVSEWTAESGIAVGGSWNDTRERILSDDIFPMNTESNAWTGFRNVCQWKKWENSVNKIKD